MSGLDERIRAALKEDGRGDELLQEQGIMTEVIAPFRGRHRWAILFATLFGVGGVGIAIWAGFRFSGAELVRDQIVWASVCLLGILINSMIKIYFWMEMHSNRILREVKRVELLLVSKSKEDGAE